MKHDKQKDMDAAVLLVEKLAELVVELCVDCDTRKFDTRHWKVFRRRVELAGKVRSARSMIEG